MSGARASVLAVAVGLGLGCSPSAFDDRRAEAWSDSNGGDGLSADYGAAVVGVTVELPGATIAVLGLDEPGLGAIEYDETGTLTQREAPISIGAAASVPTIVSAPGPVAGANGLVAVGGLGAQDQILLYDVSGGAIEQVATLAGSDCGGTGDNLGFAMEFGFTTAGVSNRVDLVALRGDDVVIFVDLAIGGPVTCLRCTLGSSSNTPGVSLALTELGGSDEAEIAVDLGGSITVFDAFQVQEASAAGARCFEIRTPQISNLTSPSVPGELGARLAVGDGDDDDLLDMAIASPTNAEVRIIPEVTSSGPGGREQILPPPNDSGAFGSGPIAFLDLDADGRDELVVGDPAASPNGVAGAGQVSVFTYSDDGEYELRGVLFDSTPEPGQQFGRSVAVTEFVFGQDDVDMLVVGAAGEAFTYFRPLIEAVDPRL